NPVDMTVQVSSRPEVLAKVLNAVAEDPTCDALILQSANAFHLPRLRDVFLAALEQVRADYPRRLILLCCRAPAEVRAKLNAMGYPTVEGIDAACATLAALVRFGSSADLPSPAEPDAGFAQTRPGDALAPEAFASEAGAKAALAAASIPILKEVVAATRDAAAAAARDIGFPVVLKIVSPDIAHKTEVGGVVVGVPSEAALCEQYDAMLDRVRQKAPQARITGVLVAQMAPAGTELILGSKKDPVFGPVVMVGLGGIFAEVFRDIALQVAPVSEAQALDMLRSLKSFPLLDGARGRPKADVAAAARAVAALSQFAARHADAISEIDVNPLVVLDAGRGAFALDALLVPEPTKGSQP
ncbi:MAG: acetate--CoA ligase family protein, partial [Gammaproteobacteria bacterium]|nr:acetate--CoA ligase family protein [Gammaproteobacteria bacterium]